MSVTLFYASDVHGAEVLWKKFVNAGKFYGAQVLVMGGDIAGKAVVPVVERPGGYTVERIAGQKLLSEDEVVAAENRVRDQGLYPMRMRAEQLESLRQDPAAMSALFLDAMKESFRRWLDLAAQRLEGTGIKLFVMTGNDDEPALREVLAESRCAVDCEDVVVDVGEGFEMVSCGWSNPTPWNSPRELPEDQLEKRLEEMVGRLGDPRNSIFNFHVPPYGTAIDRAPKLDESLKPVIRGGQMLVESVGSQAVRRLIERHQPAAALHGHIHEARGVVKLGRTVCINPGSVYSEGMLHGALLELRRGKDVTYHLTSG